ncbi:hypothetical protein JEQ12_000518 [Ovis aries]|uniref:Selenoprotein F n=1 Tax=Ovis aries TaxID=9940 RepID=A0A836D9Q5_SHEEP|nr:hypothetical protein JEQ12_000518 [Ovis aries]
MDGLARRLGCDCCWRPCLKRCMQELFLKSVDENWGGSLKSKYVRGSDPVLKLLDDSGNIAEELSILKWNTDSVEEFLSEKLERI